MTLQRSISRTRYPRRENQFAGGKTGRLSSGERLAFPRTAPCLAAMAVALLAALPLPAAAADCSATATDGIDWSRCDRRNLMLTGAELKGANLSGADFGWTDLREAEMTSANLERAKLVRASLAGAVADEADFTKIEGYRTDFSHMSAKGASFRSAELQRADFTDAVLTGASFVKAEAGRAIFTGAHLGANDFSFANLSRADFSKADIVGPLDFSNAYMFLTRIEGTDLTDTKGLVQSQVDLACGDDATKLPAGLTKPKAWPCGAD